MNNKIERYLIPADGPETLPIIQGLALVDEISKKSESSKDAILFIPTKRNIQGTTLETSLGTEISKALLKDKPVKLPSGGYLKLETEKTFRNTGTKDIIFGVYVNKKMLDQIDSIKNTPAVIVIPWIMDDDVNEWKRAWNPKIPGESQTTPEKLIDNPVVEEALKVLSISVNLSSGLTEPRYRSMAADLFRILYKNNEKYDPNSIRAWGLRNNWTPKGADQLRDVAQAILDRRPIARSKMRVWKKDLIEILRKRAKCE